MQKERKRVDMSLFVRTAPYRPSLSEPQGLVAESHRNPALNCLVVFLEAIAVEPMSPR